MLVHVRLAYILFNRDIAQAPSNEIWVRYNDRSISFKQSTLENMEISNVEGLIEHVKVKLRKDIENIYEKAIILRRGDEVLSSETSISGLYNTKGNALEVVIDGKNFIRSN